MCSNCNKNESKISEYGNGTETQQTSANEIEDIKVWDVITYVYKVGDISWKNLKDHIIEERLSYPQKYLLDDFIEESISMCDLCLSLLTDTYKTLKKFESLTHQASLIRKVQNICKKNRENCAEVESSRPSVITVPTSLSLSSPGESGNADLFDSFNFADDHPLDETEDCFTKECKYEITDDSFEKESLSVPQQGSTSIRSKVNHSPSPEQSVPVMSFKSSKQLVLKIEKLSDLDLKYYNEKKRTKTDSTTEVVQGKGQKIMPVQKLHSSFIKTKTSRQLKKEKTAILNDKKKYECRICGKRFANLNVLRKEHMPIHLQDKSCKLCGLVFTNIRSIKSHMKVVHNQVTDEEYECKICGKTFANRNVLRKEHMPIHVQDMSCKLCNKVFINLDSFRKHLQIIHKQASEEFLKRMYKTCEICGRKMLRRIFKRHMETHGPREILKCDKCDKEYMTKVAYDDHLLTHSDNFTPHLCRHCGKTFDNTKLLCSHERRCGGERKFSCKICSKTFFEKHEIKKHMNVHSNSKERPFVCDECGVSFTDPSNLRRHKRIHEELSEKGEYSSKCEFCGKLFKHSERLRFYMQSHEKPFECSFCGKILSTAKVLRKHKDLHKKNPEYQPRKYWRIKS